MLLREVRVTYSAQSGLANAKFSYRGRPHTSQVTVEGLVGGVALPQRFVSLAPPSPHNSYKAVGQFYTTFQSLNQTSVSDSVATFVKSQHSETLSINGKPVWQSTESRDGCGRVQVWSLTQFYSVDFSKSRIVVKKCVFNKHTIKVCVSCC